MCRCRACDKEIEVKWIVPAGLKTHVLESLCNLCLAWAEVAKKPGPLQPPHKKRKPSTHFLWEIGREEDS